MKTTSVTYGIRLTLAQYEHEEISVTVQQSIEDERTGDELAKEARRIALSHTTKHLKKQAVKKEGK
jgi:hypothetical protein